VSGLERDTGSCGNCPIAEEFSRGVFEEKSKEECITCQKRQRIERQVQSLIIIGQNRKRQVEENGKRLQEDLREIGGPFKS